MADGERNYFDDLEVRDAAAKAAASGKASGTDFYSGLPPAGAPPPAPEQTWREWLDDNSIQRGAADVARIGSSAATFGMWDRVRALPEVISGAKTYDQAVNDEVARTEQAKKNVGPFLSSTGEIMGGGATGASLAKAGITTLGREAFAPLWRRIAGGAVEGGLYGAAEGAGRTYTGKLPDYMNNAAWGLGSGAAVGGALPALGGAASAAYRAAADRWSGIPLPVARAGRADAAGLADLHNLGPDAMLPDAGPSMQATAQAAVQGTGGNRSSIVNALVERDRGTVPRLQADVNAAIGPPPRISAIENSIDAGRKAVNTEYAPAMAGRSVDPAHADTLIANINSIGQSKRIDLSEVVNSLMLPGAKGLPDLSPQTLLNARHRVGSMIEAKLPAVGEQDRYGAGVLKDVRDLIDAQLQVSAPGIKAVDAKFAANVAEKQALETGQKVLSKGENAIHPDDLRDVIATAQPAANVRLRQGTRADLERRVGTQANDLTELERTIGTPQDWNAQKMRAVFGDRPAQDVADSVARNRQFRETYQRVAQGSDTAQRSAAREDTKLTPSRLGGVTVMGAVLKPVEWMLDAFRGSSAQQQRESIARLMALRDPAEVLALRDRLLEHGARVGPRSTAVDKYTRAAGQGGFGAILNPMLDQEYPHAP